jgi:hypothetical protein
LRIAIIYGDLSAVTIADAKPDQVEDGLVTIMDVIAILKSLEN